MDHTKCDNLLRTVIVMGQHLIPLPLTFQGYIMCEIGVDEVCFTAPPLYSIG